MLKLLSLVVVVLVMLTASPSPVQAQSLGLTGVLGLNITIANLFCSPPCTSPNVCVRMWNDARTSVTSTCQSLANRNSGCTADPITTSGCDSAHFCSFGVCLSCGALCAATQSLLSSLLSLGVAAANLATQVSASAAVNAQANIITANTGVVVNIDASSTTAASTNALVFGQYNNSNPSTDETDSASATVSVSASVVIPNLFANVRAAVAVASGVLFRVAAAIISSYTQIAFDVSGSSAAQFDWLALNASMQVNGQGTLYFPRSHSNCTRRHDRSLNISLSGNVDFHGYTNDIDLQIQATDYDTASAQISTTHAVYTRGNIWANAAASATLMVDGRLQHDANTVAVTWQQDTTLTTNGVLWVKNQAAWSAGNLTLWAGATARFAGNGALAFIGRLKACPLGANIVIDLSAKGSLQSNPSGVVFTYDSNSYVSVSTFKCNIQIIDSTGVTYNVYNPNNPSSANSGSSNSTHSRRLLQSSTQPQAQWGSSGLSYTYGSTSAAPSAATPTHVFLAAIIAAVVALMGRMI